MDILFSHVTAVPMEDDAVVLKDAFVLVSDGKIASVGTVCPADFSGEEIDGRGKVLMPGLVNAHNHLPMSLFRGYADDCPLQTWLNDYIFPAEERLDSRSVRTGTALSLAELIAGGVTSTADMYYFCGDIAEVAAASGLNVNLSRSVVCPGPDFDPETNPGCRETWELVKTWHGWGGGQLLVDVSIHAEYTSFPPVWEYLAGYAFENGLGMQVHVSETLSEHRACLDRYGMTPTAILDRYSVWNTRAMAAHGVWLTPEDQALLSARGVTVVHNPVSNLKLGSGIAPVPALLKAGVNVALGTDSVSSNNHYDLFEEMKTAALLQKGIALDPTVLSAYDVLKMATVCGAKALGRSAGRIREGYDADLILLDFDRPHLLPCYDVISHLVYAARGSDVVMNMARGKIIYKNGDFLTLDLEQIRSELRTYAFPRMLEAATAIRTRSPQHP